MTQAIDPWILSVRSITRLRVLALGLALVFGRSANGQEPLGERPRAAPSAPVETLPPLPGDLAEPELPPLPSSDVAESAAAEIAKESDAR